MRTIAGTMEIHMELERRLAAFKQTEAVVVFQSGFAANAGTVAAVLSKEDVVVSDALNHASIIDGARLSRATIKVFPHKDVDAARQVLRDLPASQRKLLITDGVFSMDGDLGALPALCALAEEFGCIMMVDDAHASGVFGRNGRGTVDHFDMHGRVDIQVGTLSKAIGALGGYVAGTRDLIDFLYHRARPFLFSTSHPPAVAAACIAAIDVLMEEPQIIDRLWENTRFFKSGLRGARVRHGPEREPDHARDCGRGSAGDEALGSPVSGRGVRAGVGVSDRAARQGAGPHHRDRDPHPRRIAVRARRVCKSRARARHHLKRAAPLFRKARSNGVKQSGRLADFFDTYTKDLKAEDLQRLFTRDTREAYHFFARHLDFASLDHLPRHRRWVAKLRLLFFAFTLRLSPARRIVYGAALFMTAIGLFDLMRLRFADAEIGNVTVIFRASPCRAASARSSSRSC